MLLNTKHTTCTYTHNTRTDQYNTQDTQQTYIDTAHTQHTTHTAHSTQHTQHTAHNTQHTPHTPYKHTDNTQHNTINTHLHYSNTLLKTSPQNTFMYTKFIAKATWLNRYILQQGVCSKHGQIYVCSGTVCVCMDRTYIMWLNEHVYTVCTYVCMYVCMCTYDK